MSVVRVVGAVVGIATATVGVSVGVPATAQLFSRLVDGSVGMDLATETSLLGQAFANEAFRPATLTCVPDAEDPIGRPCDHFAEYDFDVNGKNLYRLLPHPTGGVLIVGTREDQTVVFDSENGGIQTLEGTKIPSLDSVEGLS